MCLCPYVCACVPVYVYACVPVCVHPYVCGSLCVCVCVCLCVRMCVSILELKQILNSLGYLLGYIYQESTDTHLYRFSALFL